MNLAIMIGFFVVVGSAGYFANRWINGKRREDKENLEEDLGNFRAACQQADIHIINKTGIKLVQNVHLTKNQLQEVTDKINPLIYLHEETLEKLIDEITNKWANFGRRLPPI